MTDNPLRLIDQYELSMLETWRLAGMLDTPATFEVFCRRLTPGLRHGVMAGNYRIARGISHLTHGLNLGDPDNMRIISHVVEMGYPDLAQWLKTYRFTGEVMAYREGDFFYPNSPVLTINGRLADIVLETFVLSVLNHDTAIASKGFRIVQAAQGRSLAEMGSRRTHEQAAVAAARAAYIVGFGATSNVEAGLTYGIPTMGTAAHAMVLSFGPEHEMDAFCSQIQAQGYGTTLLIDTYDVEEGAHRAVEAWNIMGFAKNEQLGAVRIDSGDLAEGARKVREILDKGGLTETRILVSSDLDEAIISSLRSAPIDGYGVGTKLVSAPPMGMVFKLVEVDGKPVEKRSRDKVSVGGRKVPYRVLTSDFTAYAEHYEVTDEVEPAIEGNIRRLHHPLFGRVPMADYTVADFDNPQIAKAWMEEARKVHTKSVTELPASEREPWPGDHGPYLTATRA